MEQRTCNIILCCKGHCNIGTDKALGPQESIAKYMSKECGCPEADYKGNLLYKILKTALIDFFRTSDNPGFHLQQLLEDYITREPSMSERIMTMFSLVGVQEKNDDGSYRYINGFTEQLVSTGEAYLAK